MARMKTRSEVQDERRERRTQRVTLIVTVFMLVLLVFSSFGYYFTGGSGTIRYNGYKIKSVTDTTGVVTGYTAKLDGKQLYFYTPPADTLGITLPLGFADALRTTPVLVFVFDPTDNQTMIFDQLRFDFKDSLGSQQAAGVLREGSAYNLPVLNCSMAAQDALFIKLATGTRGVTYDGGCYVVSGATAADFVLLRDRLVYTYHGVTEN